MARMMLEQKIRNCLERHPDWTMKRMSNATGARFSQIICIKEGHPMAENEPTSGYPASSPDAGLISLDKVMQRYDIHSAILRELAGVPKGKLISETELCQRAAGTDKNRFRRTVENNDTEFRLLRIKLRLDDSGDGKWFWGGADDIAKAAAIRDA